MDKSQHLIVPIASGALNTTYCATGYIIPIRLDEGHLWYIEDAYICAGTNVAAAANSPQFTLADSSGNTIASLNPSATAITATGTTLASFSSAYRMVDCYSAEGYIKLTVTNSGSSSAPVNLSLHLVIKDVRPGTAAGEQTP